MPSVAFVLFVAKLTVIFFGIQADNKVTAVREGSRFRTGVNQYVERRSFVNRNEQEPLNEIQVDRTNMYREENYTDLKVASIRRLVPVSPDGSPDATRRQKFIGQTHLMSQVGPLPVQCDIEAADLEEALRKFPQAIAKAVEDMMEDAKERRRQESSRIVVPGAGGLPGGPPSGGTIGLT